MIGGSGCYLYRSDEWKIKKRTMHLCINLYQTPRPLPLPLPLPLMDATIMHYRD